MKIKILLFFSVLLLSSSFSVQKASAQWVVKIRLTGNDLGDGEQMRAWVSSLRMLCCTYTEKIYKR